MDNIKYINELIKRDTEVVAYSRYTMAGDIFFKGYICPVCNTQHDLVDSKDQSIIPLFCSKCGQRVKIVDDRLCD